jgi:hypothetical protein
VVEELRNTSLLPNIRDDVINAMLGITQDNMSYTAYIQEFNDFLRRSRQNLIHDLHCVRFISGLANLQLYTQAKPHRTHRGCTLPLVELHDFPNDMK